MLKLNIKPGYNIIDHSKNNTNHVLFELHGAEIEKKVKRAPLNIMTLLDVSGSMEGEEKIGYLKKSIIKLIENLTDIDNLGIILYSSDVKVAMELSLMTADNKKVANHIINNLIPSGGTNIGEALRQSYETLKGFKIQENSQNRIILFTDGCATTGCTDSDLLAGMVRKRPDGFKLTTMGYGSPLVSNSDNNPMNRLMTNMGFNDLDVELLESMAKVGEGSYFLINSPDSCGQAFANELAGLLSVVAQDVKIKMTPRKNTKILEILDDVTVKNDEGCDIYIPDIYEGETKYCLIKVEHQKINKAWVRKGTVIDIDVSYTDLVTLKKNSINLKVKIKFGKKNEADKDIDKDVNTQIVLLKSIKAQECAFNAADHGDFESAENEINKASKLLATLKTKRGKEFANGFKSMASDFTKGNFINEKQQIGATLYSMKKGRTAGGKFDNMYATSIQKDIQEKFSGITSDESKSIKNNDLNKNIINNTW